MTNIDQVPGFSANGEEEKFGAQDRPVTNDGYRPQNDCTADLLAMAIARSEQIDRQQVDRLIEIHRENEDQHQRRLNRGQCMSFALRLVALLVVAFLGGYALYKGMPVPYLATAIIVGCVFATMPRAMAAMAEWYARRQRHGDAADAEGR